MEPDSFEIVFRFADVSDDLVRLRVFAPEAGRELLRLKRPPTRQGLQHLVLAAVIVGYVDEVSPRIRVRAKAESEVEAAERALYESEERLLRVDCADLARRGAIEFAEN
ncbi:MAG: hypothetical protein L0216_20765 [Planctomycetales bacterium]|nr:hypothetical protein [Planctomycetales bacterium]